MNQHASAGWKQFFLIQLHQIGIILASFFLSDALSEFLYLLAYRFYFLPSGYNGYTRVMLLDIPVLLIRVILYSIGLYVFQQKYRRKYYLPRYHTIHSKDFILWYLAWVAPFFLLELFGIGWVGWFISSIIGY